MKKIELKVNGMMCSGCENRVCNVINDNFKVKKVIANHEKGLVTIESKEELDISLVKKLITDLGFQVE